MPPFTLLPGTPSDLDEMAFIWVQAMDADPFWKRWMGTMTESQIFEWTRENLKYRIVTGVELGVMQTWKMVDESNGKVAAWTGLSLPWPESLTDEQRASLSSSWSLPKGSNWQSRNWYIENVAPMVGNAGWDRSKHFLRQGSMTLPLYQRLGLMSILTQKCNHIADTYPRSLGGPAVTYVNARPNAAKMLSKHGFEMCCVRDAELGDFDAAGCLTWKGEPGSGRTRFCAMRKEVGGGSKRGN